VSRSRTMSSPPSPASARSNNRPVPHAHGTSRNHRPVLAKLRPRPHCRRLSVVPTQRRRYRAAHIEFQSDGSERAHCSCALKVDVPLPRYWDPGPTVVIRSAKPCKFVHLACPLLAAHDRTALQYQERKVRRRGGSTQLRISGATAPFGFVSNADPGLGAVRGPPPPS
jgi:hypothetical protein